MKKIIIGSIVTGLILVIGITTIVLALVPTGMNYVIQRPNEIVIVYSKTKDFSPDALVYRDRNEEDAIVISNFYSTFCHAFEQKTLSAIFNGELNKGLEENYLDKGSNYVNINSNEENKITICFKYSSKQKIKNYEYDKLFFEISNKNAREDIIFGVGSSFSVSNSHAYYNYYYKGKANFHNLFNFIENLV